MATNSSAIQKKIETLKKGLNNKFITASQKEKIKAQVEKLESQSKALAPKKSTKTATSSSLTRLQKLVKNKKYSVYKGTGVDLKKDSDRPAKAIGKRTSKSGKTYYEYRANRIDVKQPPKKYPKLEQGGYMAKGGRLRWNNVSIHINKNTEEDMRNAGFSFDQKGNALIYYNGKEVGFLSNFNGVMLNDEYVDQLVPMFNNFRGAGVWNYRGWKQEAESKKRQYSSKMAKGGKVGMAEWAVTITSEDGESYDWDGFAKSEDDALDKAEKEAGFGSVESSVIMITDENGEKIEYAKGGSLSSIKDEYDENEDNNAHSENVVLLAKHFGTKEDLTEAKRILALHEKEGSLSSDNGKKRQQLHLKLIEKARTEMAKDGIEFAKGGYMADGGVTEKEVVESNAEMVLSQIKAVKHHAEELSRVVSTKSNIEAWVVGKIERASTDLSDITHYLEGNKDKMSMGGTVRYYAHKMDKK